jgi:hypothetical protein
MTPGGKRDWSLRPWEKSEMADTPQPTRTAPVEPVEGMNWLCTKPRLLDGIILVVGMLIAFLVLLGVAIA